MPSRLLFTSLLLVTAFLGVTSMAKSNEMPKAGDTAPDFTLPTQDGSKVQLSKLRGQWVVLYFYPKDSTPGCTVEAHNFSKDQPAYAARNATILGVSVDGIESHQKFCAKQGINFQLLADTERKVSDAYGSLNNLVVTKVAARNTFVIDPQGKIARVFPKVSPAQHSQEVLAALDELGAKAK
jgi:peroxiredoxin Q/BCP